MLQANDFDKGNAGDSIQETEVGQKGGESKQMKDSDGEKDSLDILRTPEWAGSP